MSRSADRPSPSAAISLEVMVLDLTGKNARLLPILKLLEIGRRRSWLPALAGFEQSRSRIMRKSGSRVSPFLARPREAR